MIIIVVIIIIIIILKIAVHIEHKFISIITGGCEERIGGWDGRGAPLHDGAELARTLPSHGGVQGCRLTGRGEEIAHTTGGACNKKKWTQNCESTTIVLKMQLKHKFVN